MRHHRALLGIVVIIVIAFSSSMTQGHHESRMTLDSGQAETSPSRDVYSQVSADPGVIVDWKPVIILELPGYSIPARGSAWSQMLRSEGLTSQVFTVPEVISDPSLIHAAQAILVDGSLGADNAGHVPIALVDILVGEDASVLLTGRSAWLLHMLRDRGPPSGVVSSTTQLLATPGLEGAIYLSNPIPLTLGLSLTSEPTIELPDDDVQTEASRIVDMTGASASSMASLRYESWPLDIFLIGLEDPTLLTTNGRGIVVNTIAYATALRENPISQVLSSAQTPLNDLLSGGYSYAHEATMDGTYYAVKMAESLMTSGEWSTWKSNKQGLVLSILKGLLKDYGAESGFFSASTDGSVTCKSTGQGLWVLSVMELTLQFPVSELVSYLISRQDGDGDFENHITVTYHVTEALAAAGFLGSIDTGSLEAWLRSCVIDGTKTSDPNLWGAVGSNPTSTSPTNHYASEYVQALEDLGATHNDPVKLTSWITTRTSIGDGSYRDTVGPGEEIAIGTSSALTAMAVMGTLSSENHTSGMNWLLANQHESGGFGLKNLDEDIVAKSKESYCVSVALKEMAETSSTVSVQLKNYLSRIETDLGFELMDPLPTMMWTYWLSTVSRMNHASPSVNNTLTEDYFDGFSQWTQYPFWSNITAVSAPEYGANQYRSKSVWTQYFGAATADAIGVAPSPIAVSDALNYISMSQYVTGHFRPAMFMGTAHIQNSVAAVEALYMLDSLDTIPYRSALETAMLADYSSGSWSMTGWTIEPYAGEQAAIDWLCTRAAMRLGIIDSAIASELASNINSRIQYTDLFALSCDVATLALLNASGFAVGLDSIDSNLILNALGQMPYANGWLNATVQWQPIFTAESLKMLSILGLRHLIFDTHDSSISASSNPTVSPGSILDIDVIISSSLSVHTVMVHVFGEWIKFTNVADTDVLPLPIPSGISVLGPTEVYVVVCDWSHSRAYSVSAVDVRGTLEGSLTIDTPIVSAGSLINGTVSWVISPDTDAGLTNITVRLGDPPMYEQWSYQDTSPFTLQVPTTDFTTATYNLTVTLEQENCDALVLRDTVDIVAPVNTYLLSPSLTTGTVGQQSYIDWSIHFSSNGTEIASQETIITIVDDFDQVVFTTQGVSAVGSSVFQWTPAQRGNFSYTIVFPGNGSLVGSSSSGLIHAYEDTVLTWLTTGTTNQYSEVSLEVLLETSSGAPLAGYVVHVTVTTPSSFMLFDSDLITNSTGHVFVPVTLDENGVYTLIAEYSATEYLRPSADSDSINSWSESSLIVGGLSGNNQVGQTWDIWAHLEDSVSNPVVGASVTLRIILLPSTVIAEYTRTTNSTGHVRATWDGNAAGSHRLEAEYSGSESRGYAFDSSDFSLRIPVVLTLSTSQTPEVGIQIWIEVSAEDHLGAPIDGLSVTVIVRDPLGGVQIQESGTTSAGILQIAWTPLFRGLNNLSAASGSQSWYDASFTTQEEGIYEQPAVDVIVPTGQTVPSVITVIVSVSDYHGIGISGVSVRTVITINGLLVIDVTNVTQGDGTISHQFLVSEPGALSTSITVQTQGWILAETALDNESLLGVTDITLTTPGLPIKQGTPVGIVVTLSDWSGAPLSGAQVTIKVLWSNGTTVVSVQRVTGSDGKCTLAHDFDSVGDFIINATYNGGGLHSRATSSAPQRVYIIPTILLSQSPSCMLGDSLTVYIGIIDVFNQYIVGRTLFITVEQNSILVFESQVPSEDGLVTVHWDPEDRGIATITVLHAGDPYYYTNSTSSTVSVLELVTSDLTLEPSSVDLFSNVALRYTLLTAGTRSGVMIHFEVLGLDLVPVWTSDLATNGSGVAEVFYFADDSYGILTVRASPTPDQFLIGGDTQEQLNILTVCSITTTLVPAPPTAGTDINITIYIVDQLGNPIDSLDVVVSLDDPLGNPVKLGTWFNSKTVTTSNGIAVVTFVPTMTGLYTVYLSCSGATSVHGFTDDTYHTVYSESSVNVTVSETELEVGDMLDITVLLTDYQGSPMVSRDVTVVVDGPGSSMLGPTVVVTDGSGQASWSVQIDDEGLWIVSATFDGLGVYLAAIGTADVSVRYGTEIQASLLPTGDVVAGLTQATISVLLLDSGGTPLEGFTVDYAAYHDLLGLMMTDSVVQVGQEPILLNITLDRMGNYTILLSFVGTTHYHASNAAVEVFVRGTSSVSVDVDSPIERSSDAWLNASIKDELGSFIDLDELTLSIDLYGPEGSVDLTSRLTLSTYEIQISLHGLNVGLHTLNITVMDDEVRVGCSSETPLSVVASTSLVVSQEVLPGIIGEHHEVSLNLIDSLGEVTEGATIYVSLYSPDDREIHGSPLTTRTSYTVSTEELTISWVPSMTGTYRLMIVFEGSTYWTNTEIELEVLVRYPSSLEVEHPDVMEYGQPVPLSVTLSGGVLKISDAELTIRVWNEGSMVLEHAAITSSRGRAEVSLDGLPAGELIIELDFTGSNSFAPSNVSVRLLVIPIVVVYVTPLSEVHVGANCTLNVSYSLLGIDASWIGGLEIAAFDPSEAQVGYWVVEAVNEGSTTIQILIKHEGMHQVNVTLNGLPGEYKSQSTHTIMALPVPTPIPMDAGTAPWIGGLGLVGIVAIFVWKRVGLIVSGLPKDWDG